MPSPTSSRRNLEKARRARYAGGQQEPRSGDETLLIKRLVWQWVVEPQPKPTQRELARRLGVSQPYVHKIARRFGAEGMQPMLGSPLVTFEDLAAARERQLATSRRHPPQTDTERVSRAQDESDHPVAKTKPWSFGTVRTMPEWDDESEERKDGRRITFHLPLT